MPPTDFLAHRDLRPLKLAEDSGLEPVGLAIGQGSGGLEVAVARAGRKPGQETLRAAWKDRQGGRAAPVLLVALYGEKAAVCGPAGDAPPVLLDLDAGQVERICLAALDEPNRHSALRFLWGILPEVKECRIPGLHNRGLFATHELEAGVPKRPDWPKAQKSAEPLLAKRGRELLEGLGYQIEDSKQPYSVLRCGPKKVAVAVFLDRSEATDLPSKRFGDMTPVQYALAKADEENLDYVVVDHGSSLRIHTTSGKGVGRRGRTETFIEVHLHVLPTEWAGYLWLLFSGAAICDGGTFCDILEQSHRYASHLGSRLRDRVYEFVLPDLALAIAEARHLPSPSGRGAGGEGKPTAQDLATTYEMALLVLFRLLFVAYAEDTGRLPYGKNERYRARSLKQKAREMADLRRQAEKVTGTFCRDGPSGASHKRCLSPFPAFDDSTSHWDEAVRLFHCVNTGTPKEWGVPAYDGGMFSDEPAVSRAGAALATLSIPNKKFGPVLLNLLVDPIPEGPGVFGPVDFRSLGVREFGTIYEGLLESELSVAEEDLALDKEGLYVPAGKKEPVVRKGRIYLHNTSGARKATGSYYTKSFAVDHLLDHALEPAIADHLARLDKLDERKAAEGFFDFRVADIAMGSGHFLVAAVDRIERRFSTYLAQRPLPGVMQELARLRNAALEGIQAAGGSTEGIEIENVQLLRRQIARRCIYGVDLNGVAVQLARLSLWIHTFVPGLPLSFLDRNIAQGNSLVGIATFDEVDELLKGTEGPGLFDHTADALIGSAAATVKRLGQLSDADAAEIKAARAAFGEQRALVAETARMFDILTASRLPDAGINVMAEEFDPENELIVQGYHRRALEALGELKPFHFPIAFPEVFLRDRAGFDVILGNPPWEKARVEEHGFWARFQPGLRGLAASARTELQKRMRRQRPDLVDRYEAETAEADAFRRVLMSGVFPGMGTGDPDVYKAFCWRFWRLISVGSGRIGVVLPRSALCAKGSSEFRLAVFARAAADVTFLVNNGKWVFPEVHPQYTIGLTCLTKCEEGQNAVALRGPFQSLERFVAGVHNAPILFTAEEVLGCTDTAALPLLPAAESAEVFARIRTAPRLDLNDGKSWRARPSTELHATNDKKLMTLTDDPPPGFWPVLKGESFDIWEPDLGAHYAWADPEKAIKHLHKKRETSRTNGRSAYFEFTDANWFRKPETLPCRAARIAFRDISRATDSRTVRAALLPPKCFTCHLAPIVLWPRGDEKDEAFLLGVLSSAPLDWYARRLVETHLTYNMFNPLPIPRPSRDDPRWQRVVELAGRLAAPDKRFAKWAKAVGVECGKLDAAEKDAMIHELDAVVAHLYGLSEPQLVHVFETFHEGWDYRERLEAVLGYYREWAKRG